MDATIRLIDRLRDHMDRGTPPDMRQTVKFDDAPPGPPRLDPIANMRDVTEASIQHHGVLVSLNDEIGNLNAQCADLRQKIKDQADRSVASDLAMARLRRLLLTLAGVQTLVALCLLTGCMVLVYSLLAKEPGWTPWAKDEVETREWRDSNPRSSAVTGP